MITKTIIIYVFWMIAPTNGIYDINTCLRSFELYFSVNQKTEKTILHMSINSNPKNALTDE
jgi:hypothetical protein